MLGFRIYTKQKGQIFIFGWLESNSVLCWIKDEVTDLKAGESVIYAKNNGKAAPQVAFECEGMAIRLKTEVPTLTGTHGFQYLRYEYDPEKHGKVQQIKMRFISESGFEDEHVYEMVHGHRKLVRIDPPFVAKNRKVYSKIPSPIFWQLFPLGKHEKFLRCVHENS